MRIPSSPLRAIGNLFGRIAKEEARPASGSSKRADFQGGIPPRRKQEPMAEDAGPPRRSNPGFASDPFFASNARPGSTAERAAREAAVNAVVRQQTMEALTSILAGRKDATHQQLSDMLHTLLGVSPKQIATLPLVNNLRKLQSEFSASEIRNLMATPRQSRQVLDFLLADEAAQDAKPKAPPPPPRARPQQGPRTFPTGDAPPPHADANGFRRGYTRTTRPPANEPPPAPHVSLQGLDATSILQSLRTNGMTDAQIKQLAVDFMLANGNSTTFDANNFKTLYGSRIGDVDALFGEKRRSAALAFSQLKTKLLADVEPSNGRKQ